MHTPAVIQAEKKKKNKKNKKKKKKIKHASKSAG